MNLGINTNGNNWKFAVANFFVVFLAQLAYGLYENLSTEQLPTPFECYKMVIVALVATLGFYGINRLIPKEETET